LYICTTFSLSIPKVYGQLSWFCILTIMNNASVFPVGSTNLHSQKMFKNFLFPHHLQYFYHLLFW
jgi:hypothetical protein